MHQFWSVFDSCILNLSDDFHERDEMTYWVLWANRVILFLAETASSSTRVGLHIFQVTQTHEPKVSCKPKYMLGLHFMRIKMYTHKATYPTNSCALGWNLWSRVWHIEPDTEIIHLSDTHMYICKFGFMYMQVLKWVYLHL